MSRIAVLVVIGVATLAWTQRAYSSDANCPGVTASAASTTPAPGADASLKKVADCVCLIEGKVPGFKAKKDAGCVRVATLHEYACWELAAHIAKFNEEHPGNPATPTEEAAGKVRIEEDKKTTVARVPTGSNCMVLITTNESWGKSDKVKEYILIEETIHTGQAKNPLTDPGMHPSSELLQDLAVAYSEVRAKHPQIVQAAKDLHAATGAAEQRAAADILELLMLDYRSHLKTLCEKVESAEGRALATGTGDQPAWYEHWKNCKIGGRDHFNGTLEWRAAQAKKPTTVFYKSKLSKLKVTVGFETK